MSTIGRAPYPRSVTGSACEPPSSPTPIAASATTSDASAVADDPPRVLRRTSSGFGTDPSPDGPPSVVTHAASVADNANRVPLPGDLTPDALDQLRIRPVAAWGSRRTSTTSTRAAPLASPAALAPARLKLVDLCSASLKRGHETRGVDLARVAVAEVVRAMAGGSLAARDRFLTVVSPNLTPSLT